MRVSWVEGRVEGACGGGGRGEGLAARGRSRAGGERTLGARGAHPGVPEEPELLLLLPPVGVGERTQWLPSL